MCERDFDLALVHSRVCSVDDNGIGTLAEKRIHRVLKYYFEPREEYHEVPYLGSVADIKNEQGIIEIQTAGFIKLKSKLSRFTAHTHVTVVYPVIARKEICRVDADSGEISPVRISPRPDMASDIFAEMSAISDLIGNSNFSVMLALLGAREYKYIGKSGRVLRHECDPISLIELRELESVLDYRSLMPKMPEEFTAKQLFSALRLRNRRASYALNFLRDVGIVEQVSKRGNAIIYSITK